MTACPKCRSRATKLYSLTTGLFTCQICGYHVVLWSVLWTKRLYRYQMAMGAHTR